MNDSIKHKILSIIKNYDINKNDIHTIVLIALKLKMYDVVGFLTNNIEEYKKFIKKR